MFKPHKKIPNLWVNRARWMQVFITSAWIRQNTHVQWLPLQRRDHFSPAKICSSNPWRVSRGQQRIMEESEGITGSTYLQMWQPRKKERKQEAKPWRHAGNFLFWKRFCLFVILNWGREGGKKPVCYMSQRNSFHIFVVLFPDLSRKGSSISMSRVDVALRAAWNP